MLAFWPPGDVPISGWDPCSDLFHSKCCQNWGLGPSGSILGQSGLTERQGSRSSQQKVEKPGGEGSVLEGLGAQSRCGQGRTAGRRILRHWELPQDTWQPSRMLVLWGESQAQQQRGSAGWNRNLVIKSWCLKAGAKKASRCQVIWILGRPQARNEDTMGQSLLLELGGKEQ